MKQMNFSLRIHDLGQVEKVIAGSGVVYVTIGFEYNHQGMAKNMASLYACKKHQAKLVFLDNIYMYDKKAIPFLTENSKINPPSEKGKVRQQLREMILGEVEKGNLTVLIARAADFYGPEDKNSALTIMVAQNLMKGKKAQMMGNPDKIHTYYLYSRCSKSHCPAREYAGCLEPGMASSDNQKETYN